MANKLRSTAGVEDTMSGYKVYLDYHGGQSGAGSDKAPHDIHADGDEVESEIKRIEQQLARIAELEERRIDELTGRGGATTSRKPRATQYRAKSQPDTRSAASRKAASVGRKNKSLHPDPDKASVGELIKDKADDVIAFTQNHKREAGATALALLLVAGAAGAFNIYKSQTTVEEEARASDGGVVRFSGETGIALVVNTTDDKQVVEPSRNTGLAVEIDSYANMDIHVPPEDLPKFATISDTDDPAVKKVEIDRKYLLIGFSMPTPDEEVKKGMKDSFKANLQNLKDDEKVIESDKVSPEEEAKIRMYIVEKRDAGGNLSEGNKGYYAASKLAGVGALLDTPAGQQATKEMSDATDELVIKAYEELGEQKNLKYVVEIKPDSKYTSATERLIKASKGEEIDTVVRGEKAERSAFELTKRPEFNNRISEILTGVPAK